MNKIFFTLLIVSVISGLYFIVIVNAMTVRSSLTVLPSLGIRTSIIVDDQTCSGSLSRAYCLGDTLKISNRLENVGSNNISGNLSTKIINPDDQVINRTDWRNLNISSMEIKYINTSYTVREEDEIGIYNILSNFSYNNNYSFVNCNFWVYKGIGNLRVSDDVLLFFIPPGKSKITDPPLRMWLQYACYNTTVNTSISLNAPGNWTFLDPEEILLMPTAENSTIVNVTVPMDTELGAYYGWIYANANGQQISINLTVVVIVDFYVKTKIPEDKKEVCLGSDIYAGVNITKISPPGEVDVNMTYQLLHEGNIIAEIKENLTLNDTFNSTIRVPIITVSSDAPTGNYTFLSHLQYEDVFYESADKFVVKSCEVPKPPEGGGEGGEKGLPIPPSKKELILNLSANILSMTTGNKTSFVATVENRGDTDVKDVKISIDGIPLNWIGIAPLTATITSKGTQNYLVIISVPSNAETGVYELEVQAVDELKSNTENLILIVGKNMKEIADLMADEYQKFSSEATRSLLVKDCIDVTTIKAMHDDAKIAFENGFEEYQKGNYAQAINWFEYAIPLEQKVVARVNIGIEMELIASNSSKIIIPPFYKPEEQFIRARIYLEKKEYEKICDPIEVIRKFIMVGLVFWSGIAIIFALIVVLLIVFYRFKRRREKTKVLEDVRKRLNFLKNKQKL